MKETIMKRIHVSEGRILNEAALHAVDGAVGGLQRAGCNELTPHDACGDGEGGGV